MTIDGELRAATASAPVERATSSTAPGTTLTYRPHLDGVRALAVYLVVAFHAGVSKFRGGFIGVDVFFVLSGYLVTHVLVRDLRGSNRARLSAFYARRYRRLLPASFVTLLVTGAVYAAIATPVEVHDAIGGFRAAFLYVANWFFIHQSKDYFAADINSSPVIHFWSLAVEEQFYAVWPLVLTALFMATARFGARAAHVQRVVLTVAMGCAVVATVIVSHSNLNRAYYGTDTRAYQLLAGALLALTPALFRPGAVGRQFSRWAAPVVVVVLVLLATSAFDVGPITRGIAVVVASSALIIVLENGEGVVRRAFSAEPVVYLGRVSYGTYLWHWPVIVVMTRAFHMSSTTTFAFACLVGTSLASLSFHLLERPVRISTALNGHARAVIVVGLATSVVSAVVLVPRVLDASRGNTLGATTAAVRVDSGTDPAALDWRAAEDDKVKVPNCVGRPVSDCTLVQGTGKHIVLIGDSHARMLIQTFKVIAKQDSLTFSALVMPDCPWAAPLQYDVEKDVVRQCRDRQHDWYTRAVAALRPDVVVLAHTPYDDPVRSVNVLDEAGRSVGMASPNFEQVLQSTATRTVEALRQQAGAVVIVDPIPMAPMDTLACISGAKSLDECRYVATATATPLERHYAQLAKRPGVFVLDLDRLVCPFFPICDPVVNGAIVKRDEQHLTKTFAATLAKPVEDMLHANGVL